MFRALTKGEIKQIVDLELSKVQERLIEHAITLEPTEAALEWIADRGYDPEYGARPLRRLIQNEIEDVLSDGILAGKFQIASIVRVTVDGEGNLALDPVEEGQLETPGV